MKTIEIRQTKVKTFKDISIQCERIITLNLKGYGTSKMMQVVETVYFNVLKENGGY